MRDTVMSDEPVTDEPVTEPPPDDAPANVVTLFSARRDPFADVEDWDTEPPAHISAADCWCGPVEDEPGVFVHRPVWSARIQRILPHA